MENQGRGVGRGVGRGLGRGNQPQVSATPTAEVPAPTPTPSAAEQPVRPLGRGRGVPVAQPAPVTPLPSQPAPPVPPASAGIGRGMRRPGTSTGTAPSTTVSDVAKASEPAPVRGSEAASASIEQRLAQLELAKTGEEGAGDRVRGRRPEEIGGREGVEIERARREEEARLTEKPVGKVGTKVNLMSNVVTFEAAQDAMVYEYRVDFSPQIWNPRLRVKLIEKIQDRIGAVYLFDFDNLFLAQPLAEEQEYVVDSPYSGGTAQYKLTVRKVMERPAIQSKELLNLILRELENKLKFTQIGKNRYNPQKRVALKVDNTPALEIWPGFQTSVNAYAGGVLLMADAAFRVVRVQNVRDLLNSWKNDSRGNESVFMKLVKDNLLGSIVLTPYNNRTYIVSEVGYDRKPTETFDTASGPTTYIDYYKNLYNITIKYPDQPLLFSPPSGASGLQPTEARKSVTDRACPFARYPLGRKLQSSHSPQRSTQFTIHLKSDLLNNSPPGTNDLKHGDPHKVTCLHIRSGLDNVRWLMHCEDTPWMM